MKIVFVLANSVDPEKMTHQSVQWLPKYPLNILKSHKYTKGENCLNIYVGLGKMAPIACTYYSYIVHCNQYFKVPLFCQGLYLLQLFMYASSDYSDATAYIHSYD